MKPLEEMTDRELAHFTDDVLGHDKSLTEIELNSVQALAIEMCIERLSAHPAQRIADLTGCVVTKDRMVVWRIWSGGFVPERRWTAEDIEYAVITADIPDDNRPWQESIYKPKVNVKNGGTNDE